jgi:glycosyltransferase involved in cell wall biosynthesis
MKENETVWLEFEKIFTNNYALISGDIDYQNWLKKLSKDEYPEMMDKNYVRRWTLPLTQYGKHYDYCDVCIAPLAETYMHEHIHANGRKQVVKKDNVFNKVKSELKIIEAGMKKKVLIAQDFGIYHELIDNGVNGILVNDDKKGWYKAIKKIILEEDYRKELANNLHEFVKDKYTIEAVNENRVSFYESLKSNSVKNSGKEIVLEEILEVFPKTNEQGSRIY